MADPLPGGKDGEGATRIALFPTLLFIFAGVALTIWLVLGAVVSGIIGVCMICGAFLANTPSAYVFLLLGGIVVSIVSCVFCGCICCQERSVVIVNQTHLDGPASAPAFPAQAYLQHESYPVPMHQPAFPEVPTAQQVTSAYVPRTSA